MAAKAKPGSAAIGKKELNEKEIAFLTDRIAAELNSQIRFGAEWSTLVPGVPRTLDEAIEAKKAEIEGLKAKSAAVGSTAMYLSTSGAQFADTMKPSPEAGLARKAGKL